MDVAKTTRKSSGSSESSTSARPSCSIGEINRTPPDELVTSITRDTAATQPTSSCDDEFNTSELQVAQRQERSQLHANESTPISDHVHKPPLSAATSPLSDSRVNSPLQTTEYVGNFDADVGPVHTISKRIDEGTSQEPEVTHQLHPLNREHSNEHAATSVSNVQHIQSPEPRGYRSFRSISPPSELVALQKTSQLEVFVRFLIQRAPTRQLPESSLNRHSHRLQEGFDYITITRRSSVAEAKRFGSHVPYLNYPYHPSRDSLNSLETRLNLRTAQLVSQTQIIPPLICEIDGEQPVVHKYVLMGSEAKDWLQRAIRDPPPDLFEVPDLIPDSPTQTDDSDHEKIENLGSATDDETSQNQSSTTDDETSQTLDDSTDVEEIQDLDDSTADEETQDLDNSTDEEEIYPRLRGGHLGGESMDILDQMSPSFSHIRRLGSPQIRSKPDVMYPREDSELKRWQRAPMSHSFRNHKISERDSAPKNAQIYQRKMRLFADEVERTTKTTRWLHILQERIQTLELGKPYCFGPTLFVRSCFSAAQCSCLKEVHPR